MKYIYIICELLICVHSFVWSAAKAPEPMSMNRLVPSEQDQLLAAQNALLRKQIAHVVAQQSVAAKTKQDARALAVAKKVGAHAAAVAQGRPLEELLKLPEKWEELSFNYLQWVKLVSEEEIVRLHEYLYKECKKHKDYHWYYHYDDALPLGEQPEEYLKIYAWNRLHEHYSYRVKGYRQYPYHPYKKHSEMLYLGPIAINSKRRLENSYCMYCDGSKPALPIGYVDPKLSEQVQLFNHNYICEGGDDCDCDDWRQD